VHLTLKADGGKLTGSVMGGRGGEVPIENGTFANNQLKFVTHQQGRGGGDPITLTWDGMLKGEEIAMKRMFEGRGGQPQEFMLKKEK